MSAPREPSVEAAVTASRALLGVVARSVASALDEVTLPQFRVLVLLSASGATRVGALAEHLGANPSTFTRSIDRMVRDGWVTRSPREDNRREILVDLTDRGRALVDGVTARRSREIRAILRRIPEDDRARVADGFALFADAAGEPSVADLLTLGL